VDTNGSITEEAQRGFDLEIGHALPNVSFVDSSKIYGGVYHFTGDDTETVNGWRTRITADVTPWMQLGARYQTDTVRGGQGFLEATFRLPGKASKRAHGLRARLDESPERDIDIVTGTKVTSGRKTPVENATTGNTQRVLHVDNAAASGGDGSVENPFNTLAAAQSAQAAYDVIYINRGNGTTAGYDAGLDITATGVQVIGSGTDFIYDQGRFTSPLTGTTAIGATVLRAAGLAPVITNTSGAGHGVYVTADDVTVAGVSTQNTSGKGVYFFNNGNSWNSATVDDVIVNNSVDEGIYILADAGASITNARVMNSQVNNTTGALPTGIEIAANGAGSVIDDATFSGNMLAGNTQFGIYGLAANGGRIKNIETHSNRVEGSTGFAAIQIEASDSGSYIDETYNYNNLLTGNARGINVTAEDNGSIGIGSVTQNTALNSITSGSNFAATTAGATSRIETAILRNNYLNGTSGNGVRAGITAIGGSIGDISIENNQIFNHNGNSVVADMTSAAAPVNTFDSALIKNNYVYGGTGQGIYVLSRGTIDSITIDSNQTYNKTNSGIRIDVNLSGTITEAQILNNTSSSNIEKGIYIEGITGNITNMDVTGNSIASNGSSGIEYNISSNSVTSEANFTNNQVTNSGSRGIFANISSASTVGTLTMQNNTTTGSLATNVGNGLHVSVNDSGSVLTTANITGNTSSNNVLNGFRLSTTDDGLITNSTISDNSFSGNRAAGLRVLATTGGDFTNVTLNNNTANNNTGASTSSICTGSLGICVGADSPGSTIGTAILTGNTTNSNGSNGLRISNNNATITSITVNTHTANSNAANGILARAESGGTYGSIAINNSTANSNQGGGSSSCTSGMGICVEAIDVGTNINSVTLNTNTTNSNTGDGQRVQAFTSANITTVSVTGGSATLNGSDGLEFSARDSGTIGTANASNYTASSNVSRGIRLAVGVNTGNGTISNATLTNTTTNSNGVHGISIVADNSGAILNTTITGAIANSNTSDGLNIDVNNSASASISVLNSDFTNNTVNGVDMDDDSSTGASGFVIDLGGGTLSSTGGNRIFNNGSQDISFDMDGAQLKAENNWWGVGTGLTGAETNANSGTIDADPFLATDPRP
jgi:hypothetical protein